ncbi:MAG: hypothetical protein KBT89_16810, partial [Gammaproteobacteria bacterium]|nr:hypothetical protein [Gammaproteobacteria bacterium]
RLKIEYLRNSIYFNRIERAWMDRSIINRVQGNEELDDGYIEATGADLFAMVWDGGSPRTWRAKPRENRSDTL